MIHITYMIGRGYIWMNKTEVRNELSFLMLLAKTRQYILLETFDLNEFLDNIDRQCQLLIRSDPETATKSLSIWYFNTIRASCTMVANDVKAVRDSGTRFEDNAWYNSVSCRHAQNYQCLQERRTEWFSAKIVTPERRRLREMGFRM
jgi:hypothetical protein